MEVSGLLHTLAILLPRGKEPPVPEEEEFVWALKLVWTLLFTRKICCSCQELNDNFSVVQPVPKSLY